MIRHAFRFAPALVLAAAASLLVMPTQRAEACGGFFPPRPDDRKPSLAHEQVLIVHDPAAGRQHFIRQVAFREARERFGFVVPTPTRPRVAKVNESPFGGLRTWLSFDHPPTRVGARGFGSGRGRSGGGGVSVLEVSKVGSFTAFVLAATDEKALSKWLRDNGLSSTPENDRWLAHYVALGFHYVAMRYDPPKGDGEEQPDGGASKATTESRAKAKPVKAETVRISFDTPVPYYPYLEPTHARGPDQPHRLLELWVVTPSTVLPIALRERDGGSQWVRPLRPGRIHYGARGLLERALGDELEKLLPAGDLQVQTFQDQKLSREGYGDILFASAKKTKLSEKQKKALGPLLGILDPALVKKP